MKTRTRQLMPASLIILMAGCAIFGKQEPEAKLAVYEQIDPAALPMTHFRQVDVPKTGLTIPVDPFPILTEKDLNSAVIQGTAGGGVAILLQFDIHGLMVLQESTTRARGDHLVVFLNDRPVAALLNERAIGNGQILLEGDFGEEEAKQAVKAFNVLAKRQKSM